MSSNTSKSNVYEDYLRLDYKLSDLIITFKELINKIKAIDIYSGDENIPFQEKDDEFQKLLLSEFKI